MEITQDELIKNYAVVELWCKKFAETPMAGELDRSQLKAVFESMGANFDIDEKIRERLFKEHYPDSKRKPAVREIWGVRYQEMVEFCEGFDRKGVIFKETGNQDKTIGLRQFFNEMTALAATTEEEYPKRISIVRMTAQAVNGRLKEMEIVGHKDRMFIKVEGYNTINFTFPEKPDEPRTGELPFAPVSIPSDFPSKLWEKMKTWQNK